MNSANSKKSGCVSPFLLVWLAGWSAGTLIVDGVALWNLSKQLHALTFEQVPGIVTKSEMRVDQDSDGTSYWLELEYSYEVAGIGYTNDRHRYGFESGGRDEVARMVDEYAVENSIVVYHNPADPQDSVLDRGLSAMDFFLPLFLIPFNLIMVGMFSFTIGSRVRGWFCKRPVTIKVWRRDVIWSAKIYEYLPVAVAGMVALALSFVLIFVVAFGQIVLPAWALIIPAWCIVLVGSLIAYLKTGPAARLEVDEFHQRLTVRLPRQVDTEPTNFVNIQSIQARAKSVVLETDSASIKLPCSSPSDAEWLRDWLSERCRGKASALS